MFLERGCLGSSVKVISRGRVNGWVLSAGELGTWLACPADGDWSQDLYSQLLSRSKCVC